MAHLKSAAGEAAPLILRLALGAIFVYHGAQKLGLLDPARGWDTTVAAVNGFADGLSRMGLEPAGFLAWAAALTEFLGGAFLILGFATRFAAVAVIGLMVVAIAKVHAVVGFASKPVPGGGVTPGYEFNLLIIAAALAVIVLGSGPFALDPLLGRLHKNEGGKR